MNRPDETILSIKLHMRDLLLCQGRPASQRRGKLDGLWLQVASALSMQALRGTSSHHEFWLGLWKPDRDLGVLASCNSNPSSHRAGEAWYRVVALSLNRSCRLNSRFSQLYRYLPSSRKQQTTRADVDMQGFKVLEFVFSVQDTRVEMFFRIFFLQVRRAIRA